MKNVFKYPKLLLLICTYLVTYILYVLGFFDLIPGLVHGQGYITMFIAGLLFSFGFTTPFAIAITIEMADSIHPLLGAVIAGIGAMASDMLIFQFIRFSFLDELNRLGETRGIRWIEKHLHLERIPARIRPYLVWTIAGIVIASPLPDELGISMLSGTAAIHRKPFAIFCFVLDTLGILVVLLTTETLS